MPGQSAPEGEIDPRWQAIMDVADFIPSNPEEVWSFAARWGCSDDPDLRDAIATCVLEHLLQNHFERVFPRLEMLAKADAKFGSTVCICWRFGQAELPQNAERLQNQLSLRS